MPNSANLKLADENLANPFWIAEKSKSGLYAFSVLLLFGLFTFQLWYHAVRTSATIDEPVHILAGHRHWQCGDFGINPEHPPMLKLLATAPLNFRNLIEPDWDCGSRITSKPDSFASGNLFLVENGADSIVIPTRIAASVLSLLMAVLVFLVTREMFGKWEALTALALLAFEPNLIAHGAVVTTDMALTATAFGTVYALYRYRKNSSWFRFSVVGLAFGLLLAAKHSAVILFPILLLLLLADVFFFRSVKIGLPKQILRQTTAFAAFFLVGLVLLWAFYGFQYYSIPSATNSTVSIADYIKENGRPEMVESSSAKIVDGISRTRLFPESYVYGLADIVATGSRNAFIFDRNYPTGQWFYFPLAFSVKTSVALLLLLPIGFVMAFFLRENRREFMFLLVPPVLFFAIALTSGMNLGVRHILPVYPFFIVVSAVGAVALCRKFPPFRYVLILILLFHAAMAYRIAPHYIVFANDFWGGSNNTYRILPDGNTDWGQNLKFVNEYLAQNNINDCWFVGMGNAQLKRVSQPCRIMPDTFRWWMNNAVDEPVPPIIEGTVLISTRDLPPRGGKEYLPVTQGEPIAQIGGSIFVYQGRFEVPLVAALSRVRRSGQFARLNRVEEAVTEGREAVNLAAADPRAHLALGLALLRAGQKTEARREFAEVVELTKSNPALFRAEEVRARLEIERLN